MSLMYAQMGLQTIGAISSFSEGKHNARMQEMAQKYQNAMQRISLASSLNAQTSNEIELRDAGVRASIAIQTQSMQDKGEAAVAAAASGVKGASVVASMRGLERSRLLAVRARERSLAQQARQNTQQRRNLHLGAVMGKDVSVITGPSPASALLGLGMSLIDTYDSHQAPGSRIQDMLTRKE